MDKVFHFLLHGNPVYLALNTLYVHCEEIESKQKTATNWN